MKLVAATLGIFCVSSLGHPSHGRTLRSAEDKSQDAASYLLCRATIMVSSFKDGSHVEEKVCKPILEDYGYERADFIRFEIPFDLGAEDKVKLKHGRLFVNITNSQPESQGLVIDNRSQVSIIEVLPRHLRHLQEQAQVRTMGEFSVAIVHIRTGNQVPSVSTQALKAAIAETETNFVTQYNKCSFGKLKITHTLEPVEVQVADANSREVLIQAANDKILSQMSLQQMTDLADRVLYCVPPGTGSWIGSAVANDWRFELNDEYCDSLSAAMHEFGHTIGLHHAWKDSNEYSDSTGYMGLSHVNPHWPERCFGGVHSDQLGWYSDRTLYRDTSDPAQVVRLAGIVDYDKTATNEPVLIKLGETTVIQYNRLKDFNSGTGDNVDSIAITQMIESNSHFVAGIRPGESYTHNGVLIAACAREESSIGGADVMIISIGVGSSLCSSAESSPPTPSTSHPQPTGDDSTPFPTAASSNALPVANLPPSKLPFDHSKWWQRFWDSIFNWSGGKFSSSSKGD